MKYYGHINSDQDLINKKYLDDKLEGPYYKILNSQYSFSSQVTSSNTVYEIRDVFDLEGTDENPVTINLPENCTLKFNGGCIKNCTLSTNKTSIIAPDNNIIFDNVLFSQASLITEYLIPEWFGAIGDGTTDCTNEFKKVLQNSETTKVPILIINNRIYYINNSLYTSGDHRIRICGQEQSTNHLYSSQNGFKVKNNISLFSGCTIYGYISQVSFIGTSRTNPATIFNQCEINRLRIDKCLFSQFEAIFKDTNISAGKITANRFLTCYYFAKIENAQNYKTCVDTIITDNYINGGEERNDNNCFEFSSYNGSTIANNFIDYYRVIYYPKTPSGVSTNCQGINSIANQYQVFKYFYFGKSSGISMFSINSENDIFNWTNPSTLTKLQNYTSITYTGRDNNTYEYPPYIAYCGETMIVTIKNAILERNISSSVAFIGETLTNYSYAKFDVDFRSQSSTNYTYSIKEGGASIYNNGTYKGNRVNLSGLVKIVNSLPSFSTGWTYIANGCKVRVNGSDIEYTALNVLNPATGTYSPQWIIEDRVIEEKRHYGETSNRPTSLLYKGFKYLDTGLEREVYYNGTNWESTESGPYYKILDPYSSFSSQVTSSNTVYEIRDVFDLENTTVTIPVGCTLKFEGGSIINGVVVGQDTIIEGIFDVETVSGTFLKDNILIDPKSYFNFPGLTNPSFIYSYIDTQEQFGSFCERLRKTTSAYGGSTPKCGILAPKVFKRWYPWGDTEVSANHPEYLAYRYFYPIKDFYLAGTKTDQGQTEIDGYEEVYTRKDAIEFNNTHYKCALKTNARYTAANGLGYFPVFVDENDNPIKVQTPVNPDYGCLIVPDSEYENCKFSDDYSNNKELQIPIDSTLGNEYRNQTFTNSYGVIKVDYRYVYFRLDSSDSTYFYGTAIWNPYENSTFRALNYDITNYSDKICYSIYNCCIKEDDSIFYNGEYIYIPNTIRKLKFIGSAWKTMSSEGAMRWIDIQGTYNVAFRNITFKNFCGYPIKYAGKADQTTNNNFTIEGCKFLNCMSDAICIGMSSEPSSPSTWKGIIGNINNCEFKNCSITPTSTDSCVVYIRTFYRSYPTLSNTQFVTVSNCKFYNISNKQYYMGERRAIRINANSDIKNCEFNNFVLAIVVTLGDVLVRDNILKNDSEILNLPYPEFIHDAGVIYVGQISGSNLIDTNRLIDDRHKAIVRGNNIYPIIPAIYGSQLSFSGIYIDDGRGNVLVDNNLVGPLGTARYSIECRNISTGDYADGYSSNRNRYTNNVVFNAYRMTYGSGIEGNGGIKPSVSGNIVISGEYADDKNLAPDVGIENDLPKPQYYYYNNDSISLPYNYSQNLNNTFPRSLKFISRGGNSHAKNPIFGDTRPPKPHIGEMFFDTSLSPSKYICWNGSNWVNLDGTSLSSTEHI